MGDLAIFVGYVLVGIVAYKVYKYVKLKKSQLNLVRFDQEISDLVFKRDKAMTLNRLLTDIDICDKRDENYKVLNVSWKSEVDGEIFSYDIYISDKKAANALAMKNLVNIELNNLTPDIKTNIDKLKLRSQMLGAGYKEIVADEARDVEILGGDTKVYF